jgi:hypothetical protein
MLNLLYEYNKQYDCFSHLTQSLVLWEMETHRLINNLLIKQ